MMKPHILVKSLLIFVVLLIGIWLYKSISITTTSENISHLQRFANKPFFLLKTFLAEEDVPVEVIDYYDADVLNPTFFKSLSTDTVVAFRHAEMQIAPELARSILSWVERGGVLVVSGLLHSEQETVHNNALIQQLLVRFIWPEDVAYDSTTVDINGYAAKLNLEWSYFFSDAVINKQEDFWSGTNYGTTLIQKSRGKGGITLMTDIDIWTNEQLAQEDNAIFAHHLMADADKVLLFNLGDKAHWLSTLFYDSPGTIWFTTLFIVALLWRKGMRFGSIQSPVEHTQSGFHLHLQASGNYQWRADEHQQLLTDFRRRLHQDIASRYALKSQQQLLLILPQLEEKTGLSGDTIKQILSPWQPTSEQEYVALIANLQKLRNLL